MIKFIHYKIADFCKIEKGKFSATKTPSGKFPLIVTAEERLTSNSFQFDTEAVCIPLVSSTGHGHASIKRIHYQKGKFALASILVALIPDPKICRPKYLFHLLNLQKNEYLVPLMRGSANVTLQLKDLSNLELPIPSISDQEKIISIMERLHELIFKSIKRDQLIHLLEESIFINIFGDPISNPKKWQTGELKNYTNLITKGATPTTYGFDWQSEGIIFLRSECITLDGVNLQGSKMISEEAHQFMKRSYIIPNDVLIRITGDVGTACTFPEKLKIANINQHIARIRIIIPDILPEYLCSMFNTKSYLIHLRGITSGVTHPHLSLKQIRECKIPIPPKKLQEDYGFIVKKIKSVVKKQDEHFEFIYKLVTSITHGTILNGVS